MLIFISKKTYLKLSIVFVLIFSILLFSACSNNQTEVIASPTAVNTATAIITQAPTAVPTPTATPVPEPIEIVIGGTGDIMVHKKQIEDARYTARYHDHYDYYFDHNFTYIQSALEYPDLMIGNLETVFGTLAAGEYTGFPRFNTPDIFASSLKTAGFDVLTNANNHSLDQGKNGLLHTIEVLDANGFYHTGTFDSIESYNTPLIIDVNGVKVGILASAYGYQNLGKLEEDEREYMISKSSEDYLKAEVQDLKDAGAQVIVASMHWGYEKYYELYDDQKELAPILVKAGVDIIFGHHPHILQPIEYMEVTMDDGSTHSAVVCYSLGNFLANTIMRLEQEGAICYVHLSFDPVTEEVTIVKTQVLPVYIFYDRSYYYDFHVLPAVTDVSIINQNDLDINYNLQEKLRTKYMDIVDSITDEYVEFIDYIPQK